MLAATSETLNVFAMHKATTGESLASTVSTGLGAYRRGWRLLLAIQLAALCAWAACCAMRLLEPDHPVRVFTEGAASAWRDALS